MVIAQPDRLAGQLVDVGRLDDGVAGAAEVAVPLVIGDDQHDVGLLGRDRNGEQGDEGKDQFLHKFKLVGGNREKGVQKEPKVKFFNRKSFGQALEFAVFLLLRLLGRFLRGRLRLARFPGNRAVEDVTVGLVTVVVHAIAFPGFHRGVVDRPHLPKILPLERSQVGQFVRVLGQVGRRSEEVGENYTYP